MARILIFGEVSGRFRDAFRRLGHDCWSVDLYGIDEIPADISSPQQYPEFHIKADGRTLFYYNWDMMIAHPPCQYLSNSGVRWLFLDNGFFDADRYRNMVAGATLFSQCYHAPIKRVAIENSVMHGYAKEQLKLHGVPTKHTFATQPYDYGSPETKRALWWTRGGISKPLPVNRINKDEALPKAFYTSPGKWRWLYRSLIPIEKVNALASSWSNWLEEDLSNIYT